jgi:DNA repair exonuclease SbcCD ATPase subunit
MQSFGKFHQNHWDFSSGFNCVFGPNEAGKSTVQGFLQGMFYGFYNPYTKTKRYTPSYDRFRPWDHQEYRGSVQYEVQGDAYRLNRNFIKGDESVSVVRLSDGEEITDQFPYNGTYRTIVPGEALFKMSGLMFQNTVYIQQRLVKPEDDFASEVRDNFVSIAQDFSEDVSVKNAMAHLQDQLEKVGSPNRQKTSVLGKLVAELSNLGDERLALLRSHAEMRDWFVIRRKLEEMNRDLDQVFQQLEIEEEYCKRATLEKDLAELEETKERIQQLEIEHEKVVQYRDFDDSQSEEIMELESQIRYLKDRMRGGQLQEEEPDTEWVRWPLLPGIISLIAVLFFYFSSFSIGVYGGLGVFIASILIFVWTNLSQRQSVEKASDNVDSFLSIADRRDYERMLARLYAHCQKANCAQLQEYKARVADKARLVEIERDLSHLDEVFEVQWKEKNGNLLEEELRRLPEIPTDLNLRSSLIIAEECKTNRQQRKENELEIEWLKGMIASKEEDRSLAHVEEELEVLREQAERLHLKRKGLLAAIDGLERIAGEVQEQFSPELTNNMGETLGFLTNGKYQEVRIGRDFEIRLVEGDLERVVPVDEVSAATIELVYFALRLSIHSLSGDAKTPLFLDEPFSQFDRERHMQALRLLSEYAKHKQVIFFTSQEHELDLMHELDMNPHLIQL